MSRTGVSFRHAASGSPLGRIVAEGYVKHGPGGGVPPWRILGRYALVYTLDGSGWYEDTRGFRQVIAPGDLIVVRPDLGHAYGADPGPGSHWHEYFLIFDGPAFDLWAEHGLVLDAARPVRHLEPVDAWLRRFVGVVSAAGSEHPLQDTCRLQQLLCDVLAGDTASPPAGDAPGDARWVARARALLETSDDLAAVAGQMRLGVEGFRKRFARLTGQPPARYRLARRIDRACELLSAGRATIKEAAAATGFCDEFHFSRRFKQITGESPTRFRQRVRVGDG